MKYAVYSMKSIPIWHTAKKLYVSLECTLYMNLSFVFCTFHCTVTNSNHCNIMNMQILLSYRSTGEARLQSNKKCYELTYKTITLKKCVMIKSQNNIVERSFKIFLSDRSFCSATESEMTLNN